MFSDLALINFMRMRKRIGTEVWDLGFTLG